MNKAFEKIIEKLEERTSFLSDCTKYGNKDAEQQNKSYSTMMMYEVADLVDDLIEIVKQEAEQYNNGWISVKEMLPEKAGSYLVIGKSGGAFVTRWYKPSEFHPNGHFGGNCSDYIRYWMPRPEQPQPYQPKGE